MDKKTKDFDKEFDKFYLQTVSSLQRRTDDDYPVNYSDFQSDQNANKRKSIATEPVEKKDYDVKKIKLEPESNDQELDFLTIIDSPVKLEPLSKKESNKYYDLFYKVKTNALNNKLEAASSSKKSNVNDAKKTPYSEEKRYAMKMIKQVFNKDELKSGHFPDILGKCLSKTRMPFDSNKIKIVRDSLASRFSLDQNKLDVIWYSIRSNLNMKITNSKKDAKNVENITIN